MLGMLKRRKVSGEDLLLSELYDESTFYKAFVHDLKNAKRSVIIESPYLTEPRARYFSRIISKHARNGINVRINTRHPKYHDKFLAIQSWKAIKILKKSGAKVYICSDMRHRKLAIIDDKILWDGSLNIMSQANSKEIMRRSVSELLCKQMLSFTRMQNKYW